MFLAWHGRYTEGGCLLAFTDCKPLISAPMSYADIEHWVDNLPIVGFEPDFKTYPWVYTQSTRGDLRANNTTFSL